MDIIKKILNLEKDKDYQGIIKVLESKSFLPVDALIVFDNLKTEEGRRLFLENFSFEEISEEPKVIETVFRMVGSKDTKLNVFELLSENDKIQEILNHSYHFGVNLGVTYDSDDSPPIPKDKDGNFIY